jgi:hypothetical protein
MSHQDTGSILALRHYSHSKPITCSFVSGNLENFFTVRIKGPLGTYMNILKGDPVTFGKIDENQTNVYGGFILSRNDTDITISPDMTSFQVERRKNIRHPVSLLGSVKRMSDRLNGVSTAWIKDISYEGIRICTECEFEINEEIVINIFDQNRVLDLEGLIVRKSMLFGRNEYGVQMTFKYKSSVFSVREIIDLLVLQEKRLIINHLSSL